MAPIPIALHLSPMLIAPSVSGETWTEACLERARYRPSAVGGGGAGEKKDMLYFVEGKKLMV
jgi:hypothetical protein